MLRRSSRDLPVSRRAIDEEERLAVLRRYEILDTHSEPGYDELTEMVLRGCRTDWSAMTLVDRDRQWFKAHRGFPLTETSREVSFCSVCMQSDEPLLVENAVQDRWFRDNPLVTQEPHVRFYAGYPLFSREGYGLGSVCALSMEPRTLTSHQEELIRLVRDGVQAQLEERRLLCEIESLGEAGEEQRMKQLRAAARFRAETALRAAEVRFRSIRFG